MGKEQDNHIIEAKTNTVLLTASVIILPSVTHGAWKCQTHCYCYLSQTNPFTSAPAIPVYLYPALQMKFIEIILENQGRNRCIM